MNTQSPIADTRVAAPQRRLRDRGMLGIPVLVIVIALHHLAACWNSPQPKLMAIQPHRTVHLVRTTHQVPWPTTEPRSGPSLATDDERAFNPAAISAPWPYGAGWR